jgi:hypothetical protein
MIRHLIPVVALITLGASTLAARSDEFPVLDVAPLCHGITEQSTLQEGFRTVTFDECMKAEQEDRQTMIKEWSTFSVDDRTHCTAEAKMGGDSSYTDLLTCLEMARDVRALNKSTQSDKSADAPAQKATRSSRHNREKKS